MTDFRKLKVVELRAELAKRGLPEAGKKDELIERLEEYEFQHAEPDHEMEQASSIEETEASNEPVNISPIPEPVTPEITETATEVFPALIQSEEEKRRARAIRFGLNPDDTPKFDITITVHKLEHALPNRHYRPNWKNRKHQKKVVKN